MFKSLVCASALACAFPAGAETWHFTYQGFHDTGTGDFLADRQLVGSFTGWDDDGDGTVALAEITSLVLHGYDYVACAASSNEYWQCGVDTFSYGGAGLAFTAGEHGTDPEGWVGGGHYFIAGDGEYEYRFRPDFYEQRAYLWTTQTMFTISPGPEPGAWAMLLAGVPLAVWAARRRKK